MTPTANRLRWSTSTTPCHRHARIWLQLFGKLVVDHKPVFPLTLRDVDAFLLKENTNPDRALMPRLVGTVHTSKKYAPGGFSSAEWDSEERSRYLPEYGKDMDAAKAALNQVKPNCGKRGVPGVHNADGQVEGLPPGCLKRDNIVIISTAWPTVGIGVKLVKQFVIAILKQPDRIGMLGNEIRDGNAVNGWWALDAFLFAIDEDDYGFALPSLLGGLFFGGEFAFVCHAIPCHSLVIKSSSMILPPRSGEFRPALLDCRFQFMVWYCAYMAAWSG
jgi:hypothetical protein